MTEIEIQGVSPPRGARLDDEGGVAAAVGVVKCLCLAATPTFTIMALLTGLDASPLDAFCSSGPAAQLTGMVPMYLLMSVFHSPPWLKLVFRRQGAVGRS